MGSQNFEKQENGKINLTKNCALQVYHKNHSLAMYNEHTNLPTSIHILNFIYQLPTQNVPKIWQQFSVWKFQLQVYNL